MASYQYRKSHCGDKTVVRSSYLHNGISYTGKMTSLYWIGSLADGGHIAATQLPESMSTQSTDEHVIRRASMSLPIRSWIHIWCPMRMWLLIVLGIKGHNESYHKNMSTETQLLSLIYSVLVKKRMGKHDSGLWNQPVSETCYTYQGT